MAAPKLRPLPLLQLAAALALAGAAPACVVFNEECSPMVRDPDVVTGWLGGEVSTRKPDVRTRDNPFGQLVAEAYYNAFQVLPVDVAFENAGSVRSEGICESHETVPKGPVKRKVLREVLPFDNTLVAVNLTHKQLKNTLEHAISSLTPTGAASPSGIFLHLWGMTVHADCKLPAETLNSDGTIASEGQRITSVTIEHRDGSFEEIPLHPPSETSMVRIATNSYLLGGGDGFVDMKGIDTSKDAVKFSQAGYNFEVIAEFFQKKYTQANPLPASPPPRWILTDCR